MPSQKYVDPLDPNITLYEVILVGHPALMELYHRDSTKPSVSVTAAKESLRTCPALEDVVRVGRDVFQRGTIGENMIGLVPY